MSVAARIAENLAAIRGRIGDAARRSGRTEYDIMLVAVTKYVGIDVVRELVAAGCRDLGESRPQELWTKTAVLSKANVRWHLIGHLQRNKVTKSLPMVSLIHSGDSLRLLGAINKDAVALRRRAPVLIEVNISGDAAKHGFKPTEVESNLAAIAALPAIEIRGLMAMAGREDDATAVRHEFAALRELRDQLQTIAPPEINLDDLSMGMSGDFETAIEEGATIVRIGSALFEGIEGRQ